MSVERTIEEVKELIYKYDFECISFSDDTFSIDKNRAIKIAKELKKLNVKYRIQLRVDTSSEDLIKVLAETGCIQVDVGVESGSPKVLKTLNKQITPTKIKAAFKLYKKYGLKCGATFIIGTPGETEKDIEMSRLLAREIKADYTQFFILTPYPGTPLYDKAQKEGLFLKSETNFDNFQHGGENLNPMLKVNIAPSRLIELRNELNKEFADKTVTNYLDNEQFVKDLLADFVVDPSKFRLYTDSLLKTRNIGRSLKCVMPHNL